jgi:hypothetical protein
MFSLGRSSDDGFGRQSAIECYQHDLSDNTIPPLDATLGRAFHGSKFLF